MENLNLLFYKTFYSKLSYEGKTFDDDVLKKGKRLTSAKFYEDNYNGFCKSIAPQKFLLKTAYPGLLLGVGYAHGVDTESDIKVGFSFDYVTGQPYIPGSSVKGLLRSYFEHPEVIKKFLGKDISDDDVKELMNDIFEDNKKSFADMDIFLDAIVKRGDRNGNVVGFDSITPHGDDLTKNPKPIKIIKVLPDVTLEFSFNLKNSDKVTAEEKVELFKNILCNFGIGAKTNVGYGILTAVEENELYDYPKKEAVRPFSGNSIKGNVTQHSQKIKKSVTILGRNEEPVQNCCYKCTVTGVTNFGIFIKIDGTEYSGLIHISNLGALKGENLQELKGHKIIAMLKNIKFNEQKNRYEYNFAFEGFV